MKILVTGGAGYIGSHTCVELLKEGFDIVVVDNFMNSNPEVLERISKISGKRFESYDIDVVCEEKLERVFVDHKFDSVIHFAGLKAVGESVQKPLLYYQNNLNTTMVLCKVMQKYDVKQIVFS